MPNGQPPFAFLETRNARTAETRAQGAKNFPLRENSSACAFSLVSLRAGPDRAAPEAQGSQRGRPTEGGKAMVGIDTQHEAEGIAARFLTRHGYEIIARRWRCPSGTADIIARDSEELVFAGVAASRKAHPAARPVDSEKRARLESVAAAFTSRYDAECIPFRFDVVSVVIYDGSDRAMIRHHINALG